MEDESPKLEKFKRFKGNIEKIYSDDRTIRSIAGSKKSYADPEKLKTREELLKTIKDNLTVPTKAADASEVLAATNGIYQEMIQYYTSLPLYRYTVIPSQIKKARENIDSTEKYSRVYNSMIATVDGISIEVAFPKILQMGFTYGIIYLYADKDKSSETVETIVLPYQYCKKGFATNFGTDTIIFDFKFFDDIKMSLRSSSGLKIEDDDLYSLFPEAMVGQYKKYLKKPVELRYQQLDPKFSTAISFSANGAPPKLFAAFGLVDYEIMKNSEITRAQNELEKILVHEIPHTPDGELMFELEEAVDLHNSMAKALSGVSGLKLLTTFGKTDLLELQPERTKENKSMEQAYKGIFQSAGMNPTLFVGDSKEALQASIQKDQAYVFKQLDLIVNFYNLAINNLYNFSPYQCHINLLRISNYDEQAKVQMYMNNANFGIGKLEAVVAAGIKQKDITDKYNLEQFLELDKILVPLQSAYTATPNDVKSSEQTASPAEEEAPVEDKAPVDEPRGDTNG